MFAFRGAMSRSIAPPVGDASRGLMPGWEPRRPGGSELDGVVYRHGGCGRPIFLKFFEFHGRSLAGLREPTMTHRTNGSVRVTNVNFAA
jgi:hypothetical protein